MGRCCSSSGSTGCASACIGRYLFCAWAVPSKWDRLLLSVRNKVTLQWELGIKLAASVWLVEHVAASSTPQRNLIFPPSSAPSPATQTSLCVAAKAGSPANDLAIRMGTGRQPQPTVPNFSRVVYLVYRLRWSLPHTGTQAALLF